jgi:hypothetical protein
MPQYLFESVKTGEIHTIVLHMNEEKVYLGPNGKANPGEWRRVWTAPRAAIDTRVDPYSAKDFVKATNKNGDVGSLWDRSKEMSLKRAEKEGGTDPVRQTFFEQYSKRRHGKKHPEQLRQESVKTAAQHGIKIDWGSDD